MVSPFETLIKNLVNLGFYNFVLPFIISSIIFYAILKKSKILGESNVLNATLSIALAFMIFGFPVLTGMGLAVPLTTFFTQATIFILIFAMGILMASFFYPNLQEFLVREFKRRTTLWALVALAIALFVTSGLVSVIWATFLMPPEPGAPPAAPRDVFIIAGGIIIFIVLIMIAAATVRREE